MPRSFQMLDAQAAMAFVVEQAAYIEREVNATIYPEIIYSTLVPIDTSANPFVQSVLYYSSDIYGKAKWINGNADDIPLAGSELAIAKTSVYTAAIGYGFGWEEVNYATLVGQDLQSTDAAAARRAYEEMMQGIALTGNTEKGFAGLINYPGVPIDASSAGPWTAATAPSVIMTDLNKLIMGIPLNTQYTAYANTILLPPESLALLGGIIVPDTGTTFLAWFKANNAYTLLSGQSLTVAALPNLSTGGAGGVKRGVAYRKAPEVLKLHAPMPHRFLPVYQDGPLHWVVPGVFRTGGLEVRRPYEVRYMDNI
jgi:hypothetical protein